MKDVKIGDYVRWWFMCNGERKSCAGNVRGYTFNGDGVQVAVTIFKITGSDERVLFDDVIEYINFGGKIE